MQMGAEVGLAPMAAMQNIAVVNGRPSIWGDAMLAICMASKSFDHSNFSETLEGLQGSDDWAAVCEVSRYGREQPVRVRFSVADAKQAGLWLKQGPWSQFPQRMLKYRARAFALRDCFPDLLRGFHSTEEMQDVPADKATITVSRTQEALQSLPAAPKAPELPKPEQTAPAPPQPASRAAQVAAQVVKTAVKPVEPQETPHDLGEDAPDPGGPGARTPQMACTDATYAACQKIWMKLKPEPKKILKEKYGFKMIVDIQRMAEEKCQLLLEELEPAEVPA